MSKPREFWISSISNDPYKQEQDIICDSFEKTKNFPDNDFIQVREVLPYVNNAKIKAEKAYEQIKRTQELNAKLKELGVSADLPTRSEDL